MNSFVVFFALSLSGYVKSQDCVPASRCAKSLNTVPECSADLKQDKLYICLTEVAKDCHGSQEISSLLLNLKLDNEIVCKNKELAGELKNHTDCWSQLKPCSLSFGEFYDKLNKSSKSERETMCQDFKSLKQNCEIREGVLPKCKDVEMKYLAAAYEEMNCENTTVVEITTKPSNAIKLQHLSPFIFIFWVFTL